jgi:hypothetical protein
MTDIDYHLRRARAERDIAYRSADARVPDPHMRLSALHLQRALLLQQVVRGPVGNVTPIRQKVHSAPLAHQDRLIELPSRA